MKNRSLLAAGVASLFMVAGMASAEDTDDARPARQETQKKATPEPAKCTHAPGSHIKLAKPGDCAKAARGPYRSYSRDELDSTGETNLADALRKLDPSIR
ncbi:MAG TPA: hypothetical protein VKO83_02890 [Steroidobacteraceae bacterium]|nr:hypothetical protein [Steroidobacteraceae bacterium]